VQYLLAGCLRQKGDPKAAALYREIAAAREDLFLSEMAVWHLSCLSWREQTEAAIQKLQRSNGGGSP
jgi:hypothetical protein